MIDLSIVIVNFNTKKLVLDCFDSIKSEGSGITFEVIVIDNDSKDGSVEAFKKLEKENKNFHLIANDGNYGYAKANNQGIKISKGKYLLLLNSDTLVKKNSLGALIDFAENSKDAGVIGSKLFNADGSLQPSCFNFPTIKNAILQYWFNKKGLLDKYAPKSKEATEVDAVVGASFFITPEARKKVGMLDERYWAYFEDIDYCRQTWKQGLKVYYFPKSEIIHYHGVSFKKATPDDKTRWRRLIPSSKVYHGLFKHYLINFIILMGQKWQKLLNLNKSK